MLLLYCAATDRICMLNFPYSSINSLYPDPALYRWKKLADSKKADRIPLKEDDADVIAGLQTALANATKKKEKAVSDEDRLSAAALLEDAKAKIKAVSYLLWLFLYYKLYFLYEILIFHSMISLCVCLFQCFILIVGSKTSF